LPHHGLADIWQTSAHKHLCKSINTKYSISICKANIINQTSLYTYSKKAEGFEKEQLIFATDTYWTHKKKENNF
jgi:hypothetical protein